MKKQNNNNKYIVQNKTIMNCYPQNWIAPLVFDPPWATSDSMYPAAVPYEKAPLSTQYPRLASAFMSITGCGATTGGCGSGANAGGCGQQMSKTVGTDYIATIPSGQPLIVNTCRQ